VFYSLAGVPVARLAERSNRIAILGIVLTIWSTMTALCGAAAQFVHLLLARIGVGAAEGSCSPITHALIADTFRPQQRGMALSLLTTSSPIAQLIAPLLGGYVAMIWGWRVAFVMIGLPGVVLAAILWHTVREPREQNPRLAQRLQPGRFLADLRLLLGNRAYLWLVIATIFMGQGLISTSTFTASYFLRQYDLTLAEVGMISAAGLGGAALLGTFAGGFLADRFAGDYGRSYPTVCGIGAAGAAVFYLVTFTRDSWPVAVVFLLLANFCTDLKNGPNVAAAQNMAPDHLRATASAIMMVGAVVLGGGIGPLIVGLLSDLVAAQLFPMELGQFHLTCPGGRAPIDAPAALAGACRAASAAGLRAGLMWPCAMLVIAACAFVRSGRLITARLSSD
jgi:predicted MFS family arabinose efflux permease